MNGLVNDEPDVTSEKIMMIHATRDIDARRANMTSDSDVKKWQKKSGKGCDFLTF